MRIEYVRWDDFSKEGMNTLNGLISDAISLEHTLDKSCNRLHIFAFYK